MTQEFIKIRGARVHNLKNIDLDIPKNKLVVITGLSGSGKSSLAFDTIYAEGQRRYVESLSAYARQFLGVMDKPDVDKIEGLSPAIAIDQRSASRNPRSTVGTITEVYDYLRLLFARIGKPHCPNCATPIEKQSASQIVDQIIKLPKNNQITILGPVIRGRKGEHRGILEQALKAGFVRVRIDGVIHRADEALGLNLDKQKKHDIEVVVDRVELSDETGKETGTRIADSVETALKLGSGIVIINRQPTTINRLPSKKTVVGSRSTVDNSNDFVFSELFACQKCGISLPEIAPRIFSFNSPYGACPDCQGLGSKLEIDPKLVIPNPNLTLAEGAVRPWATASHRVGRQGWYYWQLSQLANRHGFSMNKPAKNFSKENIKVILYGDSEFEGVIPNLQRRWKETESDYTRAEIEKYMLIKKCPTCLGKRLKPEALAVKIAQYSIDEISAMSIEKLIKFFRNLHLSASEEKVVHQITKEILNRLQFLIDVGLDYLTIERESTSLSGGESQRIRLATQIGSGLSGVVYILDEPSVGLHQRDLSRLINTLYQLRDLGNTVIVVEHDKQTMESADWLIDIGPGAGESGGKVIFQGTYKELIKAHTLTSDYLSGRKKIEIADRIQNTEYGQRINSGGRQLAENGGAARSRSTINRFLTIKGATEHNLKNIDVKIPLEKFVCVTGVSGSGKSTLINDILGTALSKEFYGAHEEAGSHKAILGIENLDKVIIVDQSPIGRTPRSNPATYTGTFTYTRDLFASTQEARLRGYEPGRFSFNVKGGRCEACQGEGFKKIEMYFLPDVYVECEECHGTRYNKEALEIEYKGKNIAQILAMSIEEAHGFFKNIPPIRQRLETLVQVGLGYMKLGQPATTLSGGEAQRVKLSTELARRATGKTLYILDEPTTGLHFDDVNKLLSVLHALVSRSNTVLIIEHNPEVIKTAEWIIDLGPEGGEKGGYIVAQGPIRDIIKNKKSYTGRYLR
ncbi:MAG: excinuclease ABC subunit A [Candidatus Portnoybacteria bacterium RBG_19FT_COMBO_36_7]|uniref:UvrABC system protein A n=1 Tax=Candidatus Portnoybacteria bacterium RBG_19FT_COMBO_36_7 TaxID=1801992 RepID=A0A1G2F9V6_9BACT|nr:MAG: excinuclease ABC subunit A [Candidatus Portnoybacteria bacterium RBG_19FT_COMBO_36_7]